jgi:hypothetical protein
VKLFGSGEFSALKRVGKWKIIRNFSVGDFASPGFQTALASSAVQLRSSG